MLTIHTATVNLTDLQALTEVAEAFMSEAGDYTINRYAGPAQVVRAVANAKTAIRNVEGHHASKEPALSSFQVWQSGRRAQEHPAGTSETVDTPPTDRLQPETRTTKV